MYSRAPISTDRKYKMKIGFTFWLLLAATCLSTGCVWRSAHYDPETGIVYGGGFDCFHRRWFNNMRDDLREYRCNSCNQRIGATGECDDCSDQGGSCGCGREGAYLPRRSRHYGRADWSPQQAHGSYGPYEVYGDGEYFGEEYAEGDYVDGEYFGEYANAGEASHAPPQRPAQHNDNCPHCRKQNNNSRPRPQAASERPQRQEQYTEREGWQEVSPDEYHNAASASPRLNSPPSSAPPVSIDVGEMTTIPQRSPQLNAPPASHAPSSPPPSGPSTETPSSHPQWSPPQPTNPGRSFNDASSMKWAPSRL